MNVLIVIVSILAIGLAGCSPAGDIYEESNKIVNESTNEVEESNKMMLNGQIEGYKGTIKGLELKQLIRWINSSNENEIYPTKLVINDYSNSNIILEDEKYSTDGVKDSNKYEISLEYGENEIVTTVNVNMGE